MPAGQYPSSAFDPSLDPLSLIFSQARGRQTPISYPDPDPKGEREKAYIEAITEIDKAINEAKTKSLDAWMKTAEVQATLGQAVADILGAVATGQLAHGEAVAAWINQGLKAAGEGTLALPDQKALDTLTPEFRTSAQGLSNTLHTQDGASIITDAIRASGGSLLNPDGSLTPAAKAAMDKIDSMPGNRAITFTNIPKEYAARAGSDPAAMDTLLALGEIATQSISSAFGAAPEGVDQKAWDQFASAYASRALQENRAAIPAEAWAAGVARKQRSDELLQQGQQMANSVGVSGKDKEILLQSMANVGALFNRGAGAFNQFVNAMEPDPFLKQERDLLWGRLEGIEAARGRGDPLNTAIGHLRSSMPGFNDWMQAMGFRGGNAVERAAIYAANHPHEIDDWVDYHAANADDNGQVDPVAAREWMRGQGRAHGTGFYTTQVGRLLQPRRPGAGGEEVSDAEMAEARAETFLPKGPEDAVPGADKEESVKRTTEDLGIKTEKDLAMWRKAETVRTADGMVLKRSEDGRIMVVYDPSGDRTGQTYTKGDEYTGPIYDTLNGQFEANRPEATAGGAPQKRTGGRAPASAGVAGTGSGTEAFLLPGTGATPAAPTPPAAKSVPTEAPPNPREAERVARGNARAAQGQAALAALSGTEAPTTVTGRSALANLEAVSTPEYQNRGPASMSELGAWARRDKAIEGEKAAEEARRRRIFAPGEGR